MDAGDRAMQEQLPRACRSAIFRVSLMLMFSLPGFFGTGSTLLTSNQVQIFFVNFSLPALTAPRMALICIQKSPRHQAAFFLPLCHLYRSKILHPRLFQGAIDAGQTG